MLKRILISIVLFLSVVLVAILAYQHYRPATAPTVANSGDAVTFKIATLTGDGIEEYVKNSSGTQYFLFYKSDNDYAYVKDYVIQPLLEELRIENLNDIQFVDFSEYSGSSAYIQKVWQISSCPSFVAVRYENGEIIVENSLQWSKDSLYDSDDLKAWMYENSIWNGVYVVDNPVNPMANSDTQEDTGATEQNP